LAGVRLVVNTDVVSALLVESIGFEFLSYLWSDPVPLFTMFFIPGPPVKVFTLFTFDQSEVGIKDFEGKLF